MIATSAPEVAPLPDVPFHIGIARGLVHAVEHRFAARPYREVPAVCGTSAVVARTWGEFVRGNEHLARRDLCPECAWVVALENGTTSTELAALTPTGAGLAALGRVMPDPLLAVRIYEHLLTAADEAERDALAHLLGHVTAHAPVLLLAEDCAAGECEHDGTEDCYGEAPTAACEACSCCTGSWAGEWEGQYVITVPAPCSVLLAVAAHYELEAAK